MTQAYKPIEAYAAMGNLRTVALVGTDGAIDWCCFPYLDSPSVFGALLDTRRGGTFRVAPTHPHTTHQEYVADTNVVRTTMTTLTGSMEVLDCMPLRGDLEGCLGSSGRPEIHRLLRGLTGEVEVELLWAPRFDYARDPHRIEEVRHGVVARSPFATMSLGGLPVPPHIQDTPEGPEIRIRFPLTADEEIPIVTRWGTDKARITLSYSHRIFDETLRAWRTWVFKPTASGPRSWAGPYRDLVIRSELTLKLLAQCDTGALAAAATTSLPETLGGVRNWDYRFAWIRDAAQIARAFYALGHTRDVDAFIRWAEAISQRQGQRAGELAIMYPLRQGTELGEEELHHLEGYGGSQPVRIGNLAAEQLQLDIYGELLGAVHERFRLEERFDWAFGPFLQQVADQISHRWKEPDFSIWEPRNGPCQFVYSKVMAWVALERACALFHQGLIPGDPDAWRQAQKEIRAWVLNQGFDAEKNSFVQVQGAPALDAANLLIPIVGFLPATDPRVQGTIDATLSELVDDGLVYRYRTDDGLPGEEGAFVLCTFWLIDALILSGRIDEATALFDSLARRANHVGLYSEQIDPSSGLFLGNFPQAYSHVGVINSALYLARAQGRR